MDLIRCYECSYPTKERFVVIPDGKLLPLCKFCQKKIPKTQSKFEVMFENLVAHEKGRPKSERPPGRPAIWDDETLAAALRFLKAGLEVREIAKRLGFSYTTTWKRLRKAKALP